MRIRHRVGKNTGLSLRAGVSPSSSRVFELHGDHAGGAVPVALGDRIEHVVERARAYDGCLDFSISADAVDPTRVNLFECWRDQTTLDAWRKVAKGGPRGKPREVAVSLYRTDKAEKPF